MKRCDHLPLLDANPGKIRALLAIMKAFRDCAPAVAVQQWRLFFETGRFNKYTPAAADKAAPALMAAKAVLGAQRLQMLRFQVVGQLDGFMGNRANEFKDTVLGSSLDETTRHQLLTINCAGAWFSREPVSMMSGPLQGQVIPDEIRKLARTIMRAVLARHRRPRFSRMNPNIDARQASVETAQSARHGDLWISVATLAPLDGPTARWLSVQDEARATRQGREPEAFRAGSHRMIHLPVRSHGRFESRGGDLAKTVQLIERPASPRAVKLGRWTHRLADGRPGELVIGLVSDMKAAFRESRKAYAPRCEEICVDFGLRTMLATDRGDLLGRDWMDRLMWHDARISGLAARLQAQGIRPNRSPRYRAMVESLRGFIETSVGRALNRLVEIRAPAHLVLERLDFRGADLSRRMNRLLANCGRSVLRAKLKDLKERFGITSVEVNPAYSSQTCSCCGYVSRTNRKAQDKFVCGACGRTIHADINGSRNLGGGRSAFDRTARMTKAESLQATVIRHLERLGAAREGVVLDPALWPPRTRDRVIPERSVYVSNRYFGEALGSVIPDWGKRPEKQAPRARRLKSRDDPSGPEKVTAPPAQDLVADVSTG
ncbi:Putative transposase DNA-binding domain protein [Paracoccus haematequi]|uniref:Transposase DNA-binding domain protein n=1 Tax=Paracoccus haematequi TaxID=2491866 RepID=A0A3S4CJF2_9RHOB|nr:zinc ribbon domain-containing protein [Paracoccus haematequi]VDS08563.1 Putative transposase DNA-binding domain protein [Paracoccus haematequi]